MIDVTCAVIRNEDDEILIVQRGESTDHPFKWEFPGGKVMPGESEDECIIREIKEELSMDIVICGRIPVVEHDYGHKQVRLIPFICDTLDDLPFLSEHLAFKWIKPVELSSVDFSGADIFIAENYLRTLDLLPASPLKIINESKDPVVDSELRAMVTGIAGTREADWVATSAAENPAIFLKLLEYSCSNEKKLAFHASWVLTKIGDKYPAMLDPFLTLIVDAAGKTENESALRSFLRIISLNDPGKIEQDFHGRLADLCFNLLNSGFSAIAIKAYSMEILYRLSKIYPELSSELAASIRNMMHGGSAGIVSKSRMILRRLER